jgi:hypothetical protein
MPESYQFWAGESRVIGAAAKKVLSKALSITSHTLDIIESSNTDS